MRFVVLTQWAVEAVTANGAPREKLMCNRLGSESNLAGRKPMPEQRPTVLPLSVGYVGRLTRLKAYTISPGQLPTYRAPYRYESSSAVQQQVKLNEVCFASFGRLSEMTRE